MRVIEGQDVNELYFKGANMLRAEGRDEPSRVGDVRVFPEPVCSTYRNPRQRVLLDKDRKCNPFFHLFESLWMLAGRDDVAALNYYITDFGTRFAEPSGRIHGAYGHRWRVALGFDQLDAIVKRLQNNQFDRQCVLQMWDANRGDVLTNAGQAPLSNDLLGDWKDRPCNTHVYFRLRNEIPVKSNEFNGMLSVENTRWLDMQINCRSNDIIFGAYGANAVHFSVLMEYVAGRVGAQMGTMEQVSFNYHAYKNITDKMGAPVNMDSYALRGLESIPMGNNWDEWDADLGLFFLWHRELVERGNLTSRGYVNSWFFHTAAPMFHAHFKWKNAMKEEARRIAQTIYAPDWRYACLQWMDQRTEARSR